MAIFGPFEVTQCAFTTIRTGLRVRNTTVTDEDRIAGALEEPRSEALAVEEVLAAVAKWDGAPFQASRQHTVVTCVLCA